MELKASAKATAEKIKFLSSEVAIKYLEEDLIEAEKEIEQLELEKINQNKKDIDMEVIMENVAYFLEHLEELLIGSSDPLKRAAYFGLIFDIVPTYLDLTSGTPKLAPYFGLKKGVAPLSIPDGEPTGPWVEHLFDSLIKTYNKLIGLGFNKKLLSLT